ncbi:RecBCD enzyme subunit RecB [compost metagenome]
MPDFIFRLPLNLTDAQRLAIDDYDESLVVTGGPGSGKTTVTIFRFLTPVRNNEDALLFTYNRTLLASIKGILRNKSEELFEQLDEETINLVIENKVSSFYKWYGWFENTHDEDTIETRFNSKITSRGGRKYAEIFFDEAQDLTPSVFAKAFVLAEKVTCGADNSQDLQSNFPPDEALSIILEKLNDQKHTDLQPLEQNFRNTKEIFEFARGFVPDDENVQNLNIDELNLGEIPEILNKLSPDSQLRKIQEIIEANPVSNIGVLVNYGNQVDQIKRHLEENGYSCQTSTSDNKTFSYYYNGMSQEEEQIMFDRMKTPFICTYDSSKGLEFDIVILPFFNDAEAALTKRKRKKNEDGSFVYEQNFDGSPKMWATRNHYYVGATRARTLLYVLCDSIPELLNFHTNWNKDDANSVDIGLPI